MAVIEGGAVANLAAVDTNLNLAVAEGLPVIGAAGGYYSVTGQSPGVVAAALVADVMLMSARMAVGSSRKAYITRVKFAGCVATNGGAGGIAGVMGLRRFTAQTPTGGVARTSNRMNETAGTISDVTDIRDSNAALTGSAPTWGTIVTTFMVPLVFGAVAAGLTNGEFIYDIEFPYPIVLAAGDGIALRSVQAMAATQTWVYSYTFNWFER